MKKFVHFYAWHGTLAVPSHLAPAIRNLVYGSTYLLEADARMVAQLPGVFWVR